MYKLMKYKRVIMFTLSLVAVVCLAGMFWYVWDSFYSNRIIQPFYRKGNWLVLAIYTALLYVFTKVYGGYKVGYYRVSEIIYSQVLALLFTNVITYWQISLIGRRFMWSVPMIVVTVAQIAFVVLWAYGANRVYFRVFHPRKMLLVYGSRSATRLVYKMSKRSDKYLICAAISAEEDFETLAARVAEFEAVVLCDVKSALRNRLLKFCYERSIRVYITPKLSDIIVGNAAKIHLFDTPLFLCRNNGLSLEQRMGKRALDLLFSSVALILLSPVMLGVAVAIKLSDKGPVLFKQKRLTINGRVFEVYKFRSMVVDAEKDGVARLASQNDDRITPVGHFLRKLRLDELPQLLNVLKGDMSIVGPRPERPEIARTYKESMPEFDFRLKVKAGLTGYAQVLGKYNTLPYDKLKLDLIYIESYNLLLDLRLILMTLKILFIPESTEGIEDGGTTPLDEQDNLLP
jgi:exopolysaccharide biosynthesis polyprenyl glycosylphosphotransferase